jgi:ATP-binding cassette subfamily B protein
VVWLLVLSLRSGAETGGILLLVYWALSIPALGQEIAVLGSQYPRLRNTMMRFIEPLGAREEESEDAAVMAAGSHFGVAIEMDSLAVSVSGQSILEDIDIRIEPGEHVAIIGSSGAGKSTFASLLLGWSKPERGELTVDGVKLHGAAVASLRRRTVWVSQEVQLWNRPLFDNLRYGSTDGPAPLAAVLDQAELSRVVEREIVQCVANFRMIRPPHRLLHVQRADIQLLRPDRVALAMVLRRAILKPARRSAEFVEIL